MMRSFVGVLRAGLMTGAIVSSIAVAEGADVWEYSAERASFYTQTGASAPAPSNAAPYAFRAVVEGDIFSGTFEASVRTPLGGDILLDLDEEGSFLLAEIPMPTLSALNTIAPTGAYTFLFDTENDGITVAQLTLDSAAFPSAVPQVVNYGAAQEVDATEDFVLTFNTFGNIDGTERWELEILENGFEVYGDFGVGGSVTIPADSLFTDSTYEARLRFVREAARDTTSYPGVPGTIEVYNETRFSLVTGTGGNGGGGDDTAAPVLFLTSPAAGAEDVTANTPLTFIFSEPMASTQSIEWSANVNPANFNYTWFNEGMMLVATYQAGWPGESTITWKLNPTAGNAGNFRDVAGNELAANQFQGSFTTAAGGNPTDPCDPAFDDGRGAGSIFKSLGFVQTGNTAPVPDSEFAAGANAFYNPGTNQAISAVSVTGPNGIVDLANFFGNFMASATFDSAAELEAAFPASVYTMTVTGEEGGTASLTLGSTALLPVPRLSNLEALSTMNVANDFTLNFAAFTGAGASDGIFIEITGEEGDEQFTAPDPCIPRDLPNTATSVVIPANTFTDGATYRGSITFSRASHDSASIPNTTVVAGVSVRTSFEFTIGGSSTPQQPTWSELVRNPDGTLTYTIQADVGASLSIESSDTPAGGWDEVSSAVLATGSHQFTIDPKLSPKRFFRARVL